MYKKDPRFDKPDTDKTKVWRYMDFIKFVWMLDKQCLYFCNADILRKDDPFEGSYQPDKLLKELSTSKAKNLVKKMKSCGPPLTVNCWHLSDFESVAMWRLYSENNKGIAIQSTFEALVKVFKEFPDDVYMGKIRYIDYHNDQFKSEGLCDIFEPVMTKRKSFEHERELRAVIWETSISIKRTDDGSVLAPVNLKELIKGIFVSPDSPSWLRGTVESVAGKYDIEVPVKLSQLSQEPLY